VTKYAQLPAILSAWQRGEVMLGSSRTWVMDYTAEDFRRDFMRGWMETADQELDDLRRLVRFRALPWYRRAWLTLTGKAPR
jgi:hypothetical protein